MTTPPFAADGRLDSRPRVRTAAPAPAAGVTALDLGSSAEALWAVPAGEPGSQPA